VRSGGEARNISNEAMGTGGGSVVEGRTRLGRCVVDWCGLRKGLASGWDGGLVGIWVVEAQRTSLGVRPVLSGSPPLDRKGLIIAIRGLSAAEMHEARRLRVQVYDPELWSWSWLRGRH
jgi:hypothetical protein